MMSRTVVASRVLAHSGLGTLMRRSGGHRGFVVLNYHRIGDPATSRLDHGVYSATPAHFEEQLQFLKRECDVITPADIKELPRHGRGNYAIITFDDGYRDNYETALPRLKDAGLKAVFFLATGFIEQSRLSWWDEIAWMIRTSNRKSLGPTSTLPVCLSLESLREQTIDKVLGIYKTLPHDATEGFLNSIAEATGSGRAPAEAGASVWMTWDMVREMRDAGMPIGGHTVHHPILANMAAFEQELEIAGCAGAIEQHLQQPMRLFSYPRGKPDSFNQDTRSILREAQVEYAFSYYGGMNFPGSIDPLDVRRVTVDVDAPFEQLAAMVTWPRMFA